MKTLLDNLLWQNGFSYYRWKHSHRHNTSEKKHFENVHSFCWSVWPLLISRLGVTTLYVIDVYGLFALWFDFNMLDMFAGFSSIFHLAVISLERVHETLRPFRHWQLSLEAYWVAIATPCTLSLFLSTSNLHTLERFRRNPHRVVLIVVIICLATHCL